MPEGSMAAGEAIDPRFCKDGHQLLPTLRIVQYAHVELPPGVATNDTDAKLSHLRNGVHRQLTQPLFPG
jgi:hypothetical protein